MLKNSSWRSNATTLILILVLCLGVVGAVWAAPFLSNSTPTSGQVPLSAGDPASSATAVVLCGCDVDMTSISNGNAVVVNSSQGNITVESTGKSEVELDEINGTWTNVTVVDATTNVTISPDDKDNITAGSGINDLNLTSRSVGDQQRDFRYTASSQGTLIFTVNDGADVAYGLVNNDTNEGLAVDTTDSSGQLDYTDVPARSSTTDVRVEKLGTLTVREEETPHDKINTVTAQIKFFEREDEAPTIENRSTSNGEIDLTGLPVDEQFIVTVKAPNYHNRTVIVDDLSQQETVFLLHKNQSANQTRFLVDDKTGEFPEDKTQITIQRAVNRSKYGGDPSGFSWTNVAGGDLGADRAFIATLEHGARYRIRVTNGQGDTRLLGGYVAETDGTIELVIGQIGLDPQKGNTVAANASRLNRTGEQVKVKAQYNDTSDNTTAIYLEIYEFGNQSHHLLTNTTYTGGAPYGFFSHTETVPKDENQTTWVVRLTAARDGNENFRIETVVGPQREVLKTMPLWLRALLSIGTLFLVGGLFSQVNGGMGAIVTAAWGGILWYVNFLPTAIGSGVVVLAMILAGAIFIRDRRGAI